MSVLGAWNGASSAGKSLSSIRAPAGAPLSSLDPCATSSCIRNVSRWSVINRVPTTGALAPSVLALCHLRSPKWVNDLSRAENSGLTEEPWLLSCFNAKKSPRASKITKLLMKWNCAEADTPYVDMIHAFERSREYNFSRISTVSTFRLKGVASLPKM